MSDNLASIVKRIRGYLFAEIEMGRKRDEDRQLLIDAMNQNRWRVGQELRSKDGRVLIIKRFVVETGPQIHPELIAVCTPKDPEEDVILCVFNEDENRLTDPVD